MTDLTDQQIEVRLIAPLDADEYNQGVPRNAPWLTAPSCSGPDNWIIYQPTGSDQSRIITEGMRQPLADFIAAARSLVPSLLARAQKAEAENERLTASTAAITAERDMLKRGGAELGRIVERQCNWVVDATHSQDVIGEDGDGDWEIVWERLFGMAAERDALAARLASTKAKLAAVEKLRASWKTGHLPECVCLGCHLGRILAADTTPEPAERRQWNWGGIVTGPDGTHHAVGSAMPEQEAGD